MGLLVGDKRVRPTASSSRSRSSGRAGSRRLEGASGVWCVLGVQHVGTVRCLCSWRMGILAADVGLSWSAVAVVGGVATATPRST